MITNIRADLTPQQVEMLGRHLGKKSNATRKDINDFVLGILQAAVDPPFGYSFSDAPVENKDQRIVPRGTHKLMELADRERDIEPRMKGKTDSFIIGWCKVKYTQELRA